jgi:hypothetical protein
MVTAIVIIIWIVYITDVDVHQESLNSLTPAELYKLEINENVAVTSLDSKKPNPVIISTTTNDAIDRVGFLCCLTTMLFFAAPLSNLVSNIIPYITCSLYFRNY